MKRVLFWLAIAGAVGAGPLAAAEEKFSSALRATDFSSAGLEKLSPAELARLDALVRDFKRGALVAAQREAEAANAARRQAEASAARAQADARAAQEAAAREPVHPAKKTESLLSRAKVLLTPGTEIEYATIESRIVGDFRGWEGRTIFTLENGQRWQSAGQSTYVSPLISSPAAKITPGALGSFWLTVEGVPSRVKVVLVSNGK